MKSIIALVPSFVLLASCSGILVAPATQVRQVPTGSTSGITSTNSTATTLPPSPVSTSAIGTAVPTPIRQCLEIDSAPPSDAKLNGTIVFGYGNIPNDAYLLDLQSGRKFYLPHNQREGAHIRDIDVSKSGKWLAYRDTTSHRLVIAAADGQPYRNISWNDSWNYIAGWFDDDRLLISRIRGTGLYDSVVVLNPFSGEILQELLPDYPDNTMWYPLPAWSEFNDSKTVYDSQLSRVVYPGEKGGKDSQMWLILRDLESDRQILRLAGTVSQGVAPRWSPDDQGFIISAPSTSLASEAKTEDSLDHEELFSISRDGEVTQLTHLSSLYSTVRFQDYSWSPNGRYIAFTYIANPGSYPDLYPTTKPEMTGRLAVLDTLTLVIIDYCVPGYLSDIAPIWSPDGQQIIVEDYYQSGPPLKSSVYLIDIAQNFAIRIAENITPFGWMTTTP